MSTNTTLATSKSRAPTVFLAAEIGIGIRYFCQTPVLRELVSSGLNVVVLVPNPEEVKKFLGADFPTVRVERLRTDHLDHAFVTTSRPAFMLRSFMYVATNHLRVMGMSRRMSLAVPRDYEKLTRRAWETKRSRMRHWVPVLRGVAAVLNRSRRARSLFERMLRTRPLDNFHAELFRKYDPALVVASSVGWWPGEEMIFREARQRGVRTLGVVAGWDHPCSKGLPGARPDRVAAWSEVHRSELVLGSDFAADSVEIPGPVHFDIYRAPGSAMSRESYMRMHGLDTAKRLITFGCTFVGLSPNLVIVQALAEAIARGEFDVPVQLLVRLHPSHLKPGVGKYKKIRREGAQFHELAERFPDVKIESPLLGKEGVANFTTPEDARSLASLFAHTDVFVTLFSTMVLESCFNDVPVVAAAFDAAASELEDFLPISKVLDWPTHDRIIRSGAAAVARDPQQLVSALRRYLADPELHKSERRRFAEQECTFIDGKCSRRLADIIGRQAEGGRRGQASVQPPSGRKPGRVSHSPATR